MTPLWGLIYILGALLSAEAFIIATLTDDHPGPRARDDYGTLALFVVTGCGIALLWPFLVPVALIYWVAAVTVRAIKARPPR